MHHLREVRMIGTWRVRTAAQSSTEPGKLKLLRIRQVVGKKSAGAKEIAHSFGLRIAVADTVIVRAETAEQCFVVTQKRSSAGQAFIANNHGPAIWFQNT